MSASNGFHLTRTGQVGGESSQLIMLFAADVLNAAYAHKTVEPPEGSHISLNI